MSSETSLTRTRRTDEQVAAELGRRLSRVQHRHDEEKRRNDTLRKILLGAGLLALKDPVLIFRATEGLSDRDRARFEALRGSF